MIINNPRRALNDIVKDWGNKKYFIPLTHGKRYGLGDFLTQKINFAKAGAMAGFLVPGAFMYFVGTDGEHMVPKLMDTSLIYLSIGIPVITTYAGLIVGRSIDTFLENRPKKHEHEYRVVSGSV